MCASVSFIGLCQATGCMYGSVPVPVPCCTHTRTDTHRLCLLLSESPFAYVFVHVCVYRIYCAVQLVLHKSFTLRIDMHVRKRFRHWTCMGAACVAAYECMRMDELP